MSGLPKYESPWRQQEVACGAGDWRSAPLSQGPKAEIFDVFLCHNSEDKPAVRDIARKLSEENIKPWLDEEQIRPGTSWQTALEGK
jgi:TIR domain